MLKKFLNIIIVIIAAIITIMVIPIVIFNMFDSMYHSNIVESHDVESYFLKEYMEYNGGKDAEKFFNEYAHIEGYKDISFHYRDGKKMISTLNYYTVFVLDVSYEDNLYDMANSMLPDFGEPERLYNSFVIYKIEKEDMFYKKNSAFVMFDYTYSTIRYVLISNCSCRVNEVYDCINATIDGLNWNLHIGDLIFEYSNVG